MNNTARKVKWRKIRSRRATRQPEPAPVQATSQKDTSEIQKKKEEPEPASFGIARLLDYIKDLEDVANVAQGKAKHWKTGGHGHECKCMTCYKCFLIWKIGDGTIEQAYDYLLSHYIMGQEKFSKVPLHLSPRYVVRREISDEDTTENIYKMKASYQQLERVTNAIIIHQLKYVDCGHTHTNLQVDRIILDQSGIFTENPTAQYYYNFSEYGAWSAENWRRPTHSQEFERTLLVNIANKRLTGKKLDVNSNVMALELLINALGTNY